MFDVTAMTLPLSRAVISDITGAVGELTWTLPGCRQREAHEVGRRG